MDEEEGTFLLRVSERSNGYAFSFKHKQRVRHYRIQLSQMVSGFKSSLAGLPMGGGTHELSTNGLFPRVF